MSPCEDIQTAFFASSTHIKKCYCKANEVFFNQLKIFICCPFTFFAYYCQITLNVVEYETRTSQALKGHKIHHNLSTTTRYLLRLHSQNIQATIKESCRPVKLESKKTGCDLCVGGSEENFANNRSLTYESLRSQI